MNLVMTLDDNEVQKLLKQYPKRVKKGAKAALSRAVAFTEATIKDRTAKGRGVFGPFERYSTGYLKSLRKKGKNTRVDLFDKGLMLSAMNWKVKNEKLALLFFSSGLEAKKAMIHHRGIGHMPKRPFFDVARSEEKKVANVFRKRFINYLKRSR